MKSRATWDELPLGYDQLNMLLNKSSSEMRGYRRPWCSGGQCALEEDFVLPRFRTERQSQWPGINNSISVELYISWDDES